MELTIKLNRWLHHKHSLLLSHNRLLKSHSNKKRATNKWQKECLKNINSQKKQKQWAPNKSDKKEQKSLHKMSKHYSKAPQVVEEEEEVYQDKPKLHRLFNKNHKQFLKFNNQNL